MPALIASGIRKSYSGFWALKGVSLKVEEGEIFGLLGPNGAGKSTLINILLGFEKPNDGSFQYFFCGKEIKGSEIKERVSVVPQQLCFYNNFSVEKNLELMGTLYGLSGKKLRERIEKLLEKWSLKEFRKRKAQHLSGGYKRLLNIACGLVNDPAIIFLDEPTVGLDPNIRNTFWQKIIGLKTEGKTVILTTHYMDEAEHLCDRIAFIVKGNIALEFSVQELTKQGLTVEQAFLETAKEKGIKREDV